MSDDQKDIDREDEEEQGEKKFEYQKVLRAQEPSSSNQLDGIQLTPFNLTEELEDGQFDQSGNFLFNSRRKNSDDEDEQDAWAESIDWQEMSRREREKEMNGMDIDHESQSASTSNVSRDQDGPKDKFTCYKEILRIVRHDETVQKAIRRLGNSIPKRKFTKTKSKQGNEATDQSCGLDVAEARMKLEILTELAQSVLELGDVDIYQKSYDDLEDAIN